MTEDCPWVYEGEHYGYCNGCGEESPLFRDCCADGEVVEYDDCTCEDQ